MGFWAERRQEIRAETQKETEGIGTLMDEGLLRALIGETVMTKKIAMEIPTLTGCIDKLAGTVARLPIRLYQRTGNEVKEVLEDSRLQILNGGGRDTMTGSEFWKAMLEDYYLGKGGHAYIQRKRGEWTGLYYVQDDYISVMGNTDPIYKDYDILVQGKAYLPHEFFKLRRKTRDGIRNIPIQEENPLILAVAYSSLVFEETMVKKGGNKRGFIESEKTLTQQAVDSIKSSWKNLYSNNTENVVVLNSGAKFKESSNTSVEMQLNENKKANAGEICKLMGFPLSILHGGATAEDRKEYLECVVSLLSDIEAAMDKDLLLEKEKGSFYFAFDTKEITRGSLKERYDAYGVALKYNFLQMDEVRAMEDKAPLGLNFIRLGLQDVLLDPETKQIYTPNTNASADLGQLQRGEILKGGEKNED